MIHGYDPEVAIDVGVIAAVLYKNIQYWCEKNRANEKHLHDGLYWTYNSVKAYSKLFPEFTDAQVRTALKKLCEKEYIRIGNFNDDGRDRTRWFADLRPIINNIEVTNSEDCICENEQMQVSELTSASDQNDKALPNNYQITTTNNKERKKAESTRATFDEILDSYEVIKNSPELRAAWVGFIQMRQRIRAPLTDLALKLNIKKAFELAQDDPNKVLKIVNNSIAKGYRGVFPDEDRSQNSGSVDNPYTKMLKERGLT